MENFKRACRETGFSALAAVIFCLFSSALLAVFVRAYAPAQTVIFAVNQVLKCAAAFFSCLVFIHKDRALAKGAASGVLFLLAATLIFGLIGGFRFTAFFLLELVLCALCGGLGGFCGAKFRKE